MTSSVAAFAGGLAAVWLAVASPLAHLDHRLLTAHMVQHLLLMVVAAPLFLLGARSVHVLDWRLNPVLGWFAGSLTVIIWHIPKVFELALRSHPWHEFEHASFFSAGILFWWPVIYPARRGLTGDWLPPVYLFLATLPCDALSAFLTFCDHVVYRPYLAGHGYFGLSPMQDQSLAGALMWVAVTFAYLTPALALTVQLVSG